MSKVTFSSRAVAREQDGDGATDFSPIPCGTIFLFDGANLLGRTGGLHAAALFGGLSGELSSRGFQTLFFLERRALTWAICHQSSVSDSLALQEFSKRPDFIVIEEVEGGYGTAEADAAILDFAEEVPNSLCVSGDRFRDYHELHPTLVGTTRVRSVDITSVSGGGMRVTVAGLEAPIYLSESCCSVRHHAANARLFRAAERARRHGAVARARSLYALLAKSDPAAFSALAALFECLPIPQNLKMASRYDSLAFRAIKRQEQTKRRSKRLRAAARRAV